MGSCSPLTNLYVSITDFSSSPEELMNALLPKRLNSLEFLQLEFEPHCKASHSINRISQVTSNLRELNLSLSEWVSSGTILDIWRANPQLLPISIYFLRNLVAERKGVRVN